MLLDRRSFLLGLAAGLAPAVIRTPGLLMPVKALAVPDWFQRGLIVTQEEMEASLIEFETNDLLNRAVERYSVGWLEWRTAYQGLFAPRPYAPIVEG